MTKKELREQLVPYPTLVLKTHPLRIEGDLPILHDDGSELDVYQVSIQPVRNSFVSRFPRVFEKGGRIPAVPDRHVYADGELCLGTEFGQMRKLRKAEMSLASFFEEILYPFFASQSLLEMGEPAAFPQGERSHGSSGKVEEYMDFWRVDSAEETVKRLSAYVNKFRRNAPCFCGSGNKYKICHQSEVNKIGFVNRELLKFDLAEIQEWLDKDQPTPKGLGRRFRRM